MFDSLSRVNMDIVSYWQRRKNTRGRKKTFADETKPQAYNRNIYRTCKHSFWNDTKYYPRGRNGSSRKLGWTEKTEGRRRIVARHSTLSFDANVFTSRTNVNWRVRGSTIHCSPALPPTLYHDTYSSLTPGYRILPLHRFYRLSQKLSSNLFALVFIFDKVTNQVTTSP